MQNFLPSKERKRLLLLLFALTLMIVRLPSFVLPLDPDSGANAFFARQILGGEQLYGKFHPAHHLPGIYYTFVLAFRLFGDHLTSPKLLLFPWALVCALLLYFMGRSFFDEQTGILGSFFFILVSSQRLFTGMTVEMEHFSNLPLIAEFYLAIFLLRKRAPAWQFIWVGLLGAICVLYKVTFIAPLIIAGISIVLMVWITRGESHTWKIMLYRMLWLFVGFLIPLIAVAAYYASMGLWQRFILVFQLGSTYFDDANQMGGFRNLRPFGYPLFWLSVNNLALLLFGLIAIFRLVRRSIGLRTTNDLTDIALVLWLITSMALAGLRGGGFGHYILPIVPPLALMGAIECTETYKRLRTTSSEKSAKIAQGLVVFLIVLNFLWGNSLIYSNYILYRLGTISHDEFHKNVDEDEFVFNEIGDYLKAHTNPEDFIYIWSIHVEVYYYTDRTPPIDILWPYYVSATGSPERIFVPRTKYIVLDKPEKLDRPQWLMNGLAANYQLETVIEKREIYRRNSP